MTGCKAGGARIRCCLKGRGGGQRGRPAVLWKLTRRKCPLHASGPVVRQGRSHMLAQQVSCTSDAHVRYSCRLHCKELGRRPMIGLSRARACPSKG